MAAQVAIGEVEDEGQIAVRAAQALAAVAAHDEGGGAPTIDEQDPLSPVRSEGGHCLRQPSRQARAVAARHPPPHAAPVAPRRPPPPPPHQPAPAASPPPP